MAITGNKKEEKQFSKTYGLAAYEVLGVNLKYKELKELGFYVKEEDLENERDFTGERDGNQTVQLEFACKSVGSNSRLKRFSFWLENKNDRNNPDSEKGDLYKFINDQGSTAWSKKSNEYVPLNAEYAKYFTGEDDSLNPRPAKVGEEAFMAFMRACMAINFKEGGTIAYNTKKFFNGNFKDLQGDLETDFLTTVLVATTIKIKETDEGIKEIENFYGYAFAPGSYYKNVANKGEWREEDIAAIHAKIAGNVGKKGKERSYVNPLETLIAKMTDEKYPCKDVYHIGVVKDYVSDNHPQASEAAVIHSEETPVEEDGDTSKY